jgi:hypothetical protein
MTPTANRKARRTAVVQHHPDRFVDRLMEIRAAAIRNKKGMTYKVIRDVVADAEVQEFGRYVRQLP